MITVDTRAGQFMQDREGGRPANAVRESKEPRVVNTAQFVQLRVKEE